MLFLDILEDLAQILNASSNFWRNLIVWEPQLDLLEHREGDRVDEDHTTVDATSIDDENLLVAFLKAEELGLRVIVRATVVQIDEVFATLVCAHRDALLREACILLDVPDLQDPVRVQRVYAPTSLITDEINNVIVFKRRSGAQIYALKRSCRRYIVLAKLVLTIEE